MKTTIIVMILRHYAMIMGVLSLNGGDVDQMKMTRYVSQFQRRSSSTQSLRWGTSTGM